MLISVFLLASKGAAEIAAHEAVEEGDRQVQRAYKAIADRKWNEAYEATVASIDSGKLSSFFEPLAYNLRATFSFLRGDGMVHGVARISLELGGLLKYSS